MSNDVAESINAADEGLRGRNVLQSTVLYAADEGLCG